MTTANPPKQRNTAWKADTAISIHPVFLIPEDGRLNLDQADGGEQLVSYLCHGITRNPLDLRSHTRLIFLRLKQKDSTALFTALLDLFLALEDKGLSLRRHLLQRCSSRLQPHQRSILAQGLAEGLRTNMPLSDPGHSLLHKGIESDRPLVNKTRSTSNTAPADPLSEAMACLEYGQLDQALDLLEAAMMAEPGNAMVRTELLSIYTRGNMKDRYQKQTLSMIQAGCSLPSDWSL